jgi:hypothetical protein
MGKFDKKDTCEYCEENMQPVNRNKRFCSDKCRVYFNRENKHEVEIPKIQKPKLEPNSSFLEKMRNKKNGIK